MAKSESPVEISNHLLAALAPKDARRILALAQTVPLASEQILWQPDTVFSHVYFPQSGVVAMLTVVDGLGVEVAVVGREGMIGIPRLFGAERTQLRAVVQAEGEALAIPAELFQAEVERGSSLQTVLLQYADVFLAMILHSSVCGHYHTVEQRLSYWLLMTRDRLGSDEFLLTQQFIAKMLGVRRMSITPAARKLQKAGAIEYRRGRVRIVNAAGLEAAVCGCYRRLHARFMALADRLKPPE